MERRVWGGLAILAGVLGVAYTIDRATVKAAPPAAAADLDKPKPFTPDEAELAENRGDGWGVLVKDDRPEFTSGGRLILGHRGPASGLWVDTRRTTDAADYRGPQVAVITQRFPWNPRTNWAAVALWSGKNLKEGGGRMGGTPDLVMYADDDGAGFQFIDSKGKVRRLPVARLEKLLEPAD